MTFEGPPDQRRAMGSARAAAGWFTFSALAIFASIWLPLMQYYHLQHIEITAEQISESRISPADHRLEELREVSFSVTDVYSWSEQELKAAADAILASDFDWSGQLQLGSEFAPDLLESESYGLFHSGLLIPRILLAAFEVSENEAYYFAAKEFILSFAEYERSALLPKGLLWNDHALAARVITLTNFWRLYRHRPDFRLQEARQILESAERTGRLLAHEGEYTFATNHGTLQNLGLLHLSVAFPQLPGAIEFSELGLRRFDEQLSYHVSSEGVILEHSADYHRSGLEMFGYALRFMTILGRRIDPEYLQLYEQSREFYSLLRRPGGSLPRLGDTQTVDDPAGPVIVESLSSGTVTEPEPRSGWYPEVRVKVLPEAGYFVLWDGIAKWPGPEGLSQTVVAWSFFPGHGHKHADEMSVNLWASGRQWWTNVGYWPYDLAGRQEAVGWEGSNAPHLVDESADSQRETRLEYFAASPKTVALGLVRDLEGQAFFRRQLVHMSPSTWLVIDHTVKDAAEAVRSVWTTEPDVELWLSPDGKRAALTDPRTEKQMTVLVDGSSDQRVSAWFGRGEDDQRTSWVVVGPRDVQRAPALVVENSGSDTWTSLLFVVDDSTPTDDSHMVSWSGPETWEYRVVAEQGTALIVRDQDSLRVIDEGSSTRDSLRWTRPQVQQAVGFQENRKAYERALQHHDKRLLPLYYWRWRNTWILLAAALLQEITLFFVRRYHQRVYPWIRSASVVCWVALGVWLVMVYFQT